MTQHCCVQGCRHNNKSSTCAFKKFPTDPQRSKIWETLVRRSAGSRPGAPEWKRSPCDRICECHFDDDQFETEPQDGLYKLRKYAVPHLFGSRTKFPSHRPVKVLKTDPRGCKIVGDTTSRNPEIKSEMSSEEGLLVSGDSCKGTVEEQIEYEDASFSESSSQMDQSYLRENQEGKSMTLPEGHLLGSDDVEAAQEQVNEEEMGYEEVSFAENTSHIQEVSMTNITDAACSSDEIAGTVISRADGVSVIANTAEAEAYLCSGVNQDCYGSLDAETNVLMGADETQDLNEISENEGNPSSLVPYSSEDSAGMDTADEETNAESEKTSETEENAASQAQSDAETCEEGEVTSEAEANVENKFISVAEANVENEFITVAEANVDGEFITVADKNVQSEFMTETEANIEAETEAEANIYDETEAEANIDDETEAAANIEGETETEANIEGETEANIEGETEVDANIEGETEAEANIEGDVTTEAGTYVEGEVITEAESNVEGEVITETVAYVEGEIITEADPNAEAEPNTESDANAADDVTTVPEENVEDEENTEAEANTEETVENYAIEGTTADDVRDEVEDSKAAIVENYDLDETVAPALEGGAYEANQPPPAESVIEDTCSTSEGCANESGMGFLSAPEVPELSQENLDAGPLLLLSSEIVEETADQRDNEEGHGVVEDDLAEDCDGDDGDIDDDGEGEDYAGDEEDFEDGEEMGEEVEVEIEDCSDPEMESEGGVTYIISEGMIVVEENEGPEAYQTADIGAAIEEEHIVCDDQVGNMQKTTRIVIKVPSSKSMNDTVVCTDQMQKQEVVCFVDANSSAQTIAEQADSNNAVSADASTSEINSSHVSEPTVTEHIESVEDFTQQLEEDKSHEINETGLQRLAEVAAADEMISRNTGATNVSVAAEKEHISADEPNVKEPTTAVAQDERTIENNSTLNGSNAKVAEVASLINAGDTEEQSTQPKENVESSHKNTKPKGISLKLEQKQAPATSAKIKLSEKTSTKIHIPQVSSKNEVCYKSHLVNEKICGESSKEKHSDGGNDVVKRTPKHTHNSSSHKHKNQSSKASADDKASPSVKSSSKTDSVAPKEEYSAKSETLKKQMETKEVATRSAQNDSQYSGKNAAPSKQPAAASHRTRSNSSTSKESSSKERRNSHKDDTPSRKPTNVTSRHEDSSSTVKTNSDSKVSLRSRSRKSQSETSSTINSPEPTHVKKEKIKSMAEVPPRPRQSERVSKATEKAIASGLISRRSRATAPDNSSSSEIPSDSIQDEPSASRRGKRKTDSSPSVTEETPASKRRVTRSGEGPSSSESPVNTHSLRSVRRNKPLKRKGLSRESSPAKRSHTEESSSKDRSTVELVANIPNMCRICGSKNDILINVFGPEGQTMKLSEKVHSILPIKMREDEPLPSGVCHSCVVTLIACEKLVEKCSSIDKRLRAHFHRPAEKQVKDKSETQPPSEPAKPEKSVKSEVPSSTQPSPKTAEIPALKKDENLTSSSSKTSTATRTSSRVSAKSKQADNSQKPTENPPKPEISTKTASLQEVKVSPSASKANVTSSPDVEDAPPVLEAEPPQSHIPPMNQEPSAQPPVLIPQPGKPVSDVMPLPIEDASSAMKRFGNTYRARMKPGQWEKIERGLEVIHGELNADDQEGAPDMKAVGEMQTEEFHIVDLDMNVEEVPPETQAAHPKDAVANPQSEFHIEIPSEALEEETSVQQSSPKSVIDSILVDWSGDEDDVIPLQRGNITGSSQQETTIGVHKDGVNGSSQCNQTAGVSKAPCLFGEDEEVDSASRAKSKPVLTPSPAVIAAPVLIKQESFWPDPDPGMSTTSSSEKPPSDVPWKCFVCGKRGKSLPKFLEHKKLHLNDRKLVSCPKCSESFSNMALLKSHMKVSHGDDDEDDVAMEQQPRQSRRRGGKQHSSIVDVDLAPATDGLYHCSSCQSAFTSIERLCQHKITHQNENQKNETQVVRLDRYKCTYCKRTFYDQKDYQQHLATHQPGSQQNFGLFQCGKCDMKMINQKEFIEHIQSHNSEDSFPCDHCEKVFDTKHKLRSHRSTVHKSTAYACHLCDKVCQKRITLIEHLRKHSGDNPFACPVCNKRFNRLANYKAHMTIHENARRYECPYCGKRFNRQSIQQRHIKTHTSEQSRKHRCRVCNLTFGLATEMSTHRRLHTREEVERATWEDEKLRLALTSFPCKVCQMPFNTVDDVLAHMPSHTDDERDIAEKLKNPRLECDICGKILNSKRTFNAHRSSHIDGKPYVCKICSKGYSTSTGLNYHMLSHTGERPFPCTFCNKGYKNSTDLKVHMRQHTGEFPYKCNLCNKAFRSASSLQKHGFVHTENRPFKCQFCNMSFKRESTKHNHERIHTNDRRFKCKVCARTFIQKGACDAHEKLHFRSGSTQVYMIGDSVATQRLDGNSASSEGASSSKSDKHDLFEDFEEEDFDEDDDDDEDEYIIYEDDSVEDDEKDDDDDEMIVAENSQRDLILDPLKANLKGISKGPFDDAKSSNGVDLPATNITPIPVALTGDAVPSIGDNSVHITIL